MVSILHGIPFSIRVIVMGDIPAFLESSALLIMRDSRIFFRRFGLIGQNFQSSLVYDTIFSYIINLYFIDVKQNYV